MCSLINKQLLLTAYAYLWLVEQQEAQQGSEALQMRPLVRGAVDFSRLLQDQQAEIDAQHQAQKDPLAAHFADVKQMHLQEPAVSHFREESSESKNAKKEIREKQQLADENERAQRAAQSGIKHEQDSEVCLTSNVQELEKWYDGAVDSRDDIWQWPQRELKDWFRRAGLLEDESRRGGKACQALSNRIEKAGVELFRRIIESRRDLGTAKKAARNMLDDLQYAAVMANSVFVDWFRTAEFEQQRKNNATQKSAPKQNELAAVGRFEEGDAVEYWSKSYKGYVSATVQEVRVEKGETFYDLWLEEEHKARANTRASGPKPIRRREAPSKPIANEEKKENQQQMSSNNSNFAEAKALAKNQQQMSSAHNNAEAKTAEQERLKRCNYCTLDVEVSAQACEVCGKEEFTEHGGEDGRGGKGCQPANL